MSGWASPEQALAALDSTPEGLRDEQVNARLERHGSNRLPERGRHGLGRELLSQFTHFFALTLWVSSGLAFVGGMPELGWAIAIVVVVNGLFSFAQEYRAERATRALAAMLPSLALVRRAGERRLVPAAQLVPGDILLLEEGARISADAQLLSAASLNVDNSALTGESEPVPRTPDGDNAAASGDLEDPRLVFAGSWVVSGSATALVIGTGSTTKLGALSQLTRALQRRATPLRLSMNRAVSRMPLDSRVALHTEPLFESLAGLRRADRGPRPAVARLPSGAETAATPLPTSARPLAASADCTAWLPAHRRVAQIRGTASLRALGHSDQATAASTRSKLSPRRARWTAAPASLPAPSARAAKATENARAPEAQPFTSRPNRRPRPARSP